MPAPAHSQLMSIFSRLDTWPHARLGVVERPTFLSAMGKAVTGVQLVTTNGPTGRFGMTVSAVCSVSADPPLLLACLNARSPACPALIENQAFAVSMLSAAQSSVAEVFAGRSPDGKNFDFASAEWTIGTTSSPLLKGAAATFDCELAASVKAGSHWVFFGRVVEASAADDLALLYSRGCFGSPSFHNKQDNSR